MNTYFHKYCMHGTINATNYSHGLPVFMEISIHALLQVTPRGPSCCLLQVVNTNQHISVHFTRGMTVFPLVKNEA